MLPKPSILIPAIVAGALSLGVAVAIGHSVQANQGHFVFSLDDPYIHLTIAKNLALHGTWGINPDRFSAASSAPLYTLLLALAFVVTGPTEFWAWLFCLSGAITLIVILTVRAQRFFPSTKPVLLIGFWAIVVTGLPEMMFTGMEHTWHMTIVVILAALAEKRLSEAQSWSRHDLPLLAVTLVTSALRYETIFLTVPLIWLFFRSGRKRVAAALAIASVLPATILGTVQLAHGMTFLPSTILLKGVYYEHYGIWSYPIRFLRQIDSPYWIVFLALAAVAVFQIVRRSGSRDPRLAGIAMFVSGVLCQSAFGLIERRYVGYLAALGIWISIPWLAEWWQSIGYQTLTRVQKYAAVGVIACLAGFPLTTRFADLMRLPDLSQDIYQQQYQMARFFATYYKGQTIGLNDIGLVSWAGEVRVLDLWGLGNEEIAHLRVANTYNPDRIREITNREGAVVVACYPGWFAPHGGLPPEWHPAGYWQVMAKTRTSVGYPMVFFFPVQSEGYALLQQNLKQYATQLPPDVKVGY